MGRSLSSSLLEEGVEVFGFDKGDGLSLLETYIKEASYIYHLAGVNRPERKEEFREGNVIFTKTLVDLTKKNNPNAVIVYASSIQAELDNDYGRSKLEAERILGESGLSIRIYRLSNVFGPGCRPNYNSVVATFCDNLSLGKPCFIRDRDYVVPFQYVEDVCGYFKSELGEKKEIKSFRYVYPIYECSLGHLYELLTRFKSEIEGENHLPLIGNGFELKLFKTLCFYLRDATLPYNKAKDERGYFEEIYKDKRYGQISINMAYPHIEKGGHYHTRKKEIFLTCIGNCLIKQTHIETGDTIMDEVSGDKPKRVNIIPYYSHTIENLGDIPSYTLMWISEIYDKDNPDTIRK